MFACVRASFITLSPGYVEVSRPKKIAMTFSFSVEFVRRLSSGRAVSVRGCVDSRARGAAQGGRVQKREHTMLARRTCQCSSRGRGAGLRRGGETAAAPPAAPVCLHPRRHLSSAL